MVKNNQKHSLNPLEKISRWTIKWIGTPRSLLIHTLIFIGIPTLTFLGFDLRNVLLVFTTWLSIEAIYLAIFIQMTVNRNTRSLEDVGEDIEDIQEDVKELDQDVEEISEDIDQIQAEDITDEQDTEQALDDIEKQIQQVLENLDHLKKQVHDQPQAPS